MNTDKLTLWIDALRSGEYEQGKGCLANKETGDMQYCCLGVACEVAIKDGLDLRVEYGRESPYSERNIDTDIKYYDREELVLPEAVRAWLGVSGCCVEVTVDGSPESVVDLNDSGQYAFDDIAELLEREYLL